MFLFSPRVLGQRVGASSRLCCVLRYWRRNGFGRYDEAATYLILFLPFQILGTVVVYEMALETVCLLVLSLPQLLLALLGGRLNERKLRVTLMIEPHTGVVSESV